MTRHELVVCCIFRNEGRYLAEWIEFHRLVGVNHFYLYQNRSDDEWQQILGPYMHAGIVTVQDWPYEAPCQISAYEHFIDRHRGEPIWAAFLDCDEFLFSPTFDQMTDVLNRPPYSNYGAFGVNWMMFGAGGHIERREGLVIERFVHRLPAQSPVNGHIKSIVSMDGIEAAVTSHFFACHQGTFGEAGNSIQDSFSSPSHEILRINHYHTKSWEEWLDKVSRSRADARCKRDPNEFHHYQEPREEDRLIQRFLPQLKSRLMGTRSAVIQL